MIQTYVDDINFFLGAWIITGGTNAGVMKHVGEAVRDYGLVSASTNPIIVIGVATWGCIQNKEDLVDTEVILTAILSHPCQWRERIKERNMNLLSHLGVVYLLFTD